MVSFLDRTRLDKNQKQHVHTIVQDNFGINELNLKDYLFFLNKRILE